MSDKWVDTTLGEVAQIVGGGTPKTGIAEFWGDEIVWVTPTDVTRQEGKLIVGSARKISAAGLGSSSAKLVPKGSVLVTSRATIGATAIAGCDLSTNQGFATLIPNESVNNYFLMFWVQANRAEFISRAGGNTFLEISRKNVASIPLSVPPLATQRRIVAVIDSIDEQIAALDAERAALQRVRVVLLESLIESDWDREPLGAIAEVKLGRMLSKERAAGADQAPYIRNANVQWDGLNLKDLKSMSFPPSERAKYSLNRGDILTCEGGDPGRSVLLKNDLDGIFFQKAIHRVRPIGVHPQYLYEALVHAYENGSIEDLCTVTTIAHLTAEKFKTLEIGIPPLEVQRATASTIGSIRDQIDALSGEHRRLTETRTATLNTLLSREIEIPESFDEKFPEAVAV